ncbi:unnamed protein product [Brachionus calyciflorus]|uniref:Uncharacterized protein n=1 Tax=Brachionus calyciflorus TaxID=104777 RepID=A0A814BCE0_9BILA|nr:unnamed protein product [Brachionus calyciflorus]
MRIQAVLLNQFWVLWLVRNVYSDLANLKDVYDDNKEDDDDVDTKSDSLTQNSIHSDDSTVYDEEDEKVNEISENMNTLVIRSVYGFQSQTIIFLKFIIQITHIKKNDLFDFVQESYDYIDANSNNLNTKNFIMFLGLYGTGKTTLVNYLSGVPLVSKKLNYRWIIDVESKENSLPGFEIGHGMYFKTLIPAGHQPNGKDYAFIDNPGFSWNLQTSILNSLYDFRYKIKSKNKNIWLSNEMIIQLYSMIKDIKLLLDFKKTSFVNEIFTYSAYSIMLSEVVSLIPNNVEQIEIYSSFFVNIDTSFVIPTEKYSTNAPNLIIISPKIIIEKEMIINLSCNREPSYPDNKEKADYEENGKDGLDGYNGGNLIILTNEISDIDKIVFQSRGGKGGPGQNGGDGRDGQKGQDATVDEFKIKYYDCLNNYEKSLSWGFKIFGPDKTVYSKLMDTKNCGITRKQKQIDKTCKFCLGTADIKDILDFELFGKPGKVGGNAGNGGCGGRGGQNGNLILLHVESENIAVIEYKSKYFEYGQNGRSGRIGLGGYYGDSFLQRIEIKTYAAGYSSRITVDFTNSSIIKSNERNKDGNIVFRNCPKNFIMHSNKNAIDHSLIYKSETFYISSFAKRNNLLKDLSLKELNFPIEIISAGLIKPNLFDLIERVKVFNRHSFPDLLESLKIEILEIKSKKQYNDLVINYILSTVQSEIYRSRLNRHVVLVVDLDNYIDFSMKNILEWKKLNIELKNEFENKETSIEKAIMESLTQITEMKAKSVLKQEVLVEKKNQLQEKIALRKFLNIFKIVSFVFENEFVNFINFVIEKSLSNDLNTEISQDFKEKLQNFLEKSNSTKNEENFNFMNITNISSEKLKWLKKGSDSAKLLKMFYDIQTDTGKLGENLEACIEEINKNRENYDMLYETENNIIDLRDQMLTKSIKNIKNIKDNLSQKSIANLEFNKWKIQDELNNLKFNILNNLKNFEFKDQIEMNKMMDLYPHLEKTKQERDFANFVADLSLTEKTHSIPKEYELEILSLKKILASNLIIETFGNVIKTYKYFSFPFHCDIDIELNEVNFDYQDYDKIIETYSEKLQKISRQIKSDKYLLKPSRDNFKETYEFDLNRPFYSWSFNSNSNELTSLLKGEKLIILADINQVSHQFDAIKFNSIQIHIELLNSKALDEQLQRLLKQFDVELTYLGASYFKFKNKIYEFNLDYDKIIIKTKYGSTNRFENTNESTRKLFSNQPLLSPYTFWSIQLSGFNKFESDLIFKQIIDLIKNSDLRIYLIGSGTFVSKKFPPLNKMNC